MSTQTQSYYEFVSQLPADTVVTFHNVSWEEYEELIDQVGEPAGLPMLTSEILTQFLSRLRDEGESRALLAFDEWLQSQQP